MPKWKPLFDEMEEKESDKLWQKVGEAIRTKDQKAATDEKYILEQDQVWIDSFLLLLLFLKKKKQSNFFSF